MRLLQQLDHMRVGRDEQQAAPWQRVEEQQRLIRSVKEQHGERQDEHGRVAGLHEVPLETAGDTPRRVGENCLPDQREAEIAEREKNGKQHSLVAVPQLAAEQGKGRGEHQQPEPVARTLTPGNQAGQQERPADRDRR